VFESFFYALNIYIAYQLSVGIVGPAAAADAGALNLPWFEDVYAATFGRLDPGGSMLVHMFGCWFGVGVGLVLARRTRDPADTERAREEKTEYVSNTFAFFGTMLLFALLPSFNAAFALPESQGRIAFNTVLGLCCSVVGAAIVSHSGLSTGNRFGPLEMHHATLAGGVAVASTANYFYPPVASMIVGFTVGMISAALYLYIIPFVRRFTDTTGTLALHGVPGFIGSIAALIVVSISDDLQDVFGKDPNSRVSQAAMKIAGKLPGLGGENATVALGFTFNVEPAQLWGATGASHVNTHGAIIGVSIALPLFAGIFTGLLLRLIGRVFKLTIAEQDQYQDKTTFQVPEDY
jgi:ammonium transporter Rh